MNSRAWYIVGLIVTACVQSVLGVGSVPPPEVLFAHPPVAAKPQTWWHWMNGNVTKEGVTADLEAMARIGLGGVHIFDAGCGIPAGPVAFDTPVWYDMLKHACREAKRLGLELTLSNCSGWSSSGGPWVQPRDAMKYIYVFTTNVIGGTTLAYPLPKPVADDHGFSADIATIAFPTPGDDVKIPNWKDQTFQRRVPMKTAAFLMKDDRTEPGPGGTVKRDEIVTLTGPWTAPAGRNWTVLRIGYACNGQRNHPASFNGCGLEVDKLAAEPVARHFDAYAGKLLRELGVTPGHNDSAFRGLLVDSYETDCQTWTQGFEKTFAARQGYDLAPFLPTLAGYVVDDLPTTEKFLFDYRRTVADLFAESYAGTLRRKCDEYGLDLYLEAYGNGPFEFLQYGSRATVPMGEFWFETDDYPDTGRTAWGWWCINGMCSPIAHVHGRKIVAAESFSAAPWNARWKKGPFEWKATGDKAYCDGVSRVTYHRFAHQPWTNVWPGMTMGQFGSHFERTCTWWEQGTEWIRYQTRCQALLQYGDWAADVLYFRSEDPLDDNAFFLDPLGYGWKHDTICREDFLKLLVEDGKVFLPGGTRYARLALPKDRPLSRAVRAKLENLLTNRAVLLKDDNSNLPAPDVDVPPGFHDKTSWCHRIWPDGSSAYFVMYGRKESQEVEFSFRQTGKVVEFWHPDTGTIERAERVREADGRTFVKVPFDPCGSVFVVFRDRSMATAKLSPETKPLSEAVLEGPWNVTFIQRVTNSEPETRKLVMTNLADWTKLDDPFFKYFSGTATYRLEHPGAGELDLGEVKNMAEVRVDGRRIATLWKPPFRCALPAGKALEIRITNHWANRMIGDEELPPDCEYEPDLHAADKNWPGHAVKSVPAWVNEGKRSPTGRYTFSTWRHFRKGDELLPSGLIGPVKIRREVSESIHDVFAHPPAEARLQMWYHWIGDCVTEEGLVADMKAMGELGVGTAHIFAPSMAELPVKAKPMDAEWLRLFSVAIREAKKNGLTLGFHNCPGWSSSGGPWITAENSMKKVVWSETDVPADASGEICLPQPPTNLGFYRDIAVYAFPIHGTRKPIVDPFPRTLNTEKPGTSATCELEYETAFRPRFFLFRTERDRTSGVLVVEAEGEDGWKEVGKTELSPWDAVTDDRTVRLSLVAPAKRFRVTFTSAAFPAWMGQHDTKIVSASFSELPLVENVAKRNSSTNAYGLDHADNPDEHGLDPLSVLDLTASLRADGTLHLATSQLSDLSTSQFRILRIGYTTTGARPGPATVDGLECDKLDKRGVEAHWAAMPAKILALPGAKGTVSHCIIDSYEVGGQNWTEILPGEFAKRRGYPLDKHLVTVCGYALETMGKSLEFLWDWQKTIGELFAENYYDRFTELCHENGVKSVLEPYGGPFDALLCGRSADVPTGEFWLGRACYGSPRLAASLAHLHGKVRAATESFTTDEEEGRWTGVPHKFRVAGDQNAWLNGINQIVFHSYLHQPFANAKPGLSLGRHGSQFNRNTTWWKEGRGWADYVRRGQALLQYGKPVAEFLVWGGPPADELMRLGFNYDFCGEADIGRFELRDGKLVVRGAGSYAALILRDDEAKLSPTSRKRLADLERQGARIVRGMFSGKDAEALGCCAPFDGRGQLQAIRRAGEKGETVWFVVNVSDGDFDGAVRFAYDLGTSPERFDAKSGNIESLAFAAESGFAAVPLSLRPHESTFVVFSPSSSNGCARVPLGVATGERRILPLADDWTITSFSGPAAPIAPLKLKTLASWSDSPDPKLRHFAGRAVYERRVEIEGARLNGQSRVLLDLGDVHDIANVWVNGRFVGTLWEPPFRVDIASALPTPGSGFDLKIEVVNCWPNRMIGDAIARANGAAEAKVEDKWPQWVLDGRADSGTGIFTWSCWSEAFRPDDELFKAGLLGPVKLEVTK